jgi:hypothetical protein
MFWPPHPLPSPPALLTTWSIIGDDAPSKDVISNNKIDPMCEEVELMLLSKIKKSITISILNSSWTTNEGQESFKVTPTVIAAPHLMVATPERMHLEQKVKILMEENSVSTTEFFPSKNTMQEGSFSMAVTQTPLQTRSEADQLIVHALIKSLSSFKQNEIAPLSPSILYNSSSEKEVVVVSKTGNQGCNRKLLFRKPNIKVIRDLLTKKWIIIKLNR